MDNLTPRAVVAELDKYIVGQDKAKRMVAVALRNRYRRQQLPADLKEEVIPKNILMIGPTGVGKTEIARRLAKMVGAPFIKVEATKFTEVGYVGRDVESIVRDLVEAAIRMVRAEKAERMKPKARELADERILDLLAPLPTRESKMKNPFEMIFGGSTASDEDDENDGEDEQHKMMQQRMQIRQQLHLGLLDEEYVEIEVESAVQPSIELFPGSGMEELGINFQDVLGGLFPKKKKSKRVKIFEAKRILTHDEAQKLVDMDEVAYEAIQQVEESGIVFLDEMDKIAGAQGGAGPDVSREGVQRDILPIVEGSTVMTKYGPVKTDYMLFIAAGAFHVSKPSDLIPELQGRFPIRVELESLNKQDFIRILTEPRNALVRQYRGLLGTEGIQLIFTADGVEEIADFACQVNEQTDNIGARRLYTIMEKVLEDISFSAEEMAPAEIRIDQAYVRERLADIVKDRDLSKYIL
jgi:ATP-dependent HslUV protease ATP-binding subunit HslU